jgi:cytochrome c553
MKKGTALSVVRLHWAVAALGSMLFALMVAPVQAAGDIAAGEQKAANCIGCHGPAGKSSNAMYPVLAGQPAQMLVTQLFMFRAGKRKNDQMSPFAASLTNADLNDLAAYFSSQTVPPPLRKSDPVRAAAGKLLTEQNNCVACHGANLMGQQQMPRLAGQHMEYLRTQLTAFKNSTRADMDGNMTSAAQGLSPQDIDVLADYLSGLGAP